VSQKRVQR